MPYLHPTHSNTLRAVAFAAACLLAWPAAAHTVFLFLSIDDAGKLRIESGFSDGGTGEGLPVEVRHAETGVVLDAFPMPESGVAQRDAPSVPYTVTLDAGEGHKVTKPGPAKGEAARALPALVDCHWGDTTQMPAEAVESLRNAKVIVAHEWLYDRMKELFDNQTVVLVDADVSLANADGAKPAQLRDRVRQRLKAAEDAAQSVAVLCPTPPAKCPDWAWLVEEGLAEVWTAPKAQPAAASSGVPSL
jgi:hypothetical protein